MSHMSDMLGILTSQRPISRRTLVVRGVTGASVAAVGSLLAACGGGGSSSTATSQGSTGGGTPAFGTVSTPQVASSPKPSGSSGTAGKPKQGGTFVCVAHQDLAGLGPQDTGPTDQWVTVTQIHNALLELDENFILQPTLAEKFEAADDGLSYTFTLRKDVKFHNGDAFSADDVKYTFDFYRNPDNASLIMNNFQSVDSVEAADPTTVVIKMASPNAAFLARGATTFIVASKYHQSVGEKKYSTAPIGTGPFKLKEWVPADHVLLEAFPDHFRGRPNFDTFRENVVPEPSVRAIALQTGEALTTTWALLADDNLKLAKDKDKFTTFITPSLSCNHFPINNSKPYFAQKEVRQALMHAINRQKLIDDVFSGTAVIATGNISPALQFYYKKDVKTYDYDPEKAKSMLDAAGWKVGADGIREKDGQKFSFTCFVISGDQARKPEAEVVQQELKEIGIEMKIEEQPVPSMDAAFRANTADAALYNWTYGGSGGDPDASTTLRSNADPTVNAAHYKSPEMDKLLDEGLKETDPDKRQKIYYQVQDLFVEDVPFLYIMYWYWYQIFSSKVKGLPDSALNGSQLFNKVYQFWLEG